VCIEKSKEDEVEEHHFVEAQQCRRMQGRRTLLHKKEKLFTEVQLKVQQAIEL
jgi:hypothetical protein